MIGSFFVTLMILCSSAHQYVTNSIRASNAILTCLFATRASSRYLKGCFSSTHRTRNGSCKLMERISRRHPRGFLIFSRYFLFGRFIVL